MTHAAIIERDAIRALILSPAHEVLLMRVRFEGKIFWITLPRSRLASPFVTNSRSTPHTASPSQRCRKAT